MAETAVSFLSEKVARQSLPPIPENLADNLVLQHLKNTAREQRLISDYFFQKGMVSEGWAIRNCAWKIEELAAQFT